jgi:hypothetical protein
VGSTGSPEVLYQYGVLLKGADAGQSSIPMIPRVGARIVSSVAAGVAPRFRAMNVSGEWDAVPPARSVKRRVDDSVVTSRTTR